MKLDLLETFYNLLLWYRATDGLKRGEEHESMVCFEKDGLRIKLEGSRLANPDWKKIPDLFEKLFCE